ncbi:DUF6471 domain-containing protein [Burkholderia sp. Ax-1719]|uniref:DUF6471 domain-containing protein n=1 Tax=Burkholderia sp. Ax-1719 TaxID=2608334 RepID=UPI001422183C|nr:hypothetical protein [Burkholderia sp. Ax-1719]
MRLNYTDSASRTLKRLLGQRGATYADLAVKLSEIGINETEMSISQKVRRGTFQFAFFLQCLEALGVDKLSLGRPGAPDPDAGHISTR